MSRNGKIYTVNGFTGNLTQIAKHFDINYNTLLNRVNNLGWSIEKAIDTPIEEQKEIKTYTVNEFTGTLKEIAEHFDVNYGTLINRINKQNLSIEEAINIPVKEQKEKEIKIYTVNGFTGNLTQIAKHFNINDGTLRYRINEQEMSIEDAINVPIEEIKIYTVNGFTGNLIQIAEYFNLNYKTLCGRIYRGWSIEDAVYISIKEKFKGEIHTINGFTGNLTQIAEYFNISYGVLRQRINDLGWSIEDAVNTAVKEKEKYTIDDFTGNLRQIAEHFNIKYTTLIFRINKGISIEYAVNIPIKEIKNYTINGFTGNLTQIAKHFDINYGTLCSRINKQGMSIEDAVNTPIEEKEKIHTINEFTGNLKEIAKHFNIAYSTLQNRINKGMSIEDAINTHIKEQKRKECKIETYTVNDFTGNLYQIAKHFNINYQTLSYRLKQGMSIEEAINIPIEETYTANGFTGNLYQIAKHFDVNYATLYYRINKKKMSIEEAVNIHRKEQKEIKVYTINDFTGNLTQISEHFSIKYATLCKRINKGMSIEDAINIPIKERKEIKIYTINGFIGNLRQISNHFNINYGTLSYRLKQGMSIEEAVNTSRKK